MRLTRPAKRPALISLVPMIDVLLILLVFFMVTSTYLNLDMIPARSPETASAAPAPTEATNAPSVMIRLGADGVPTLRGRALGWEELKQELAGQLAQEPLTQVLILPSGAAETQALISALDVAAEVGVQRLRVVRLEELP